MKWALFCFFIMFSSCTKVSKDPEASLRHFVDYRFRPNQQKDELLAMTTGAMRDTIAQMDQSQFSSYIATQDGQLDSVTINHKVCTETACKLTYTVSYSALSNGVKTFNVDAQKTAELKWVEEGWKLSEVTDVKSSYNGQKLDMPLTGTPP